ncbi:MAG: effector binding domain-containing protein [Candidatus Heimdallarchaeota archaeon]|nr:helix-turn-helix domain-containing protein [Candidatus Heimdallarchaeota archaeon]MCG3256003.1 effector binding domain-containing protein [Candidatus Heimdallarchaeota archaeon]MCK4611073.1 effector binding domain-containing protein [Candidatus Heimdallarchaeota archaeon]
MGNMPFHNKESIQLFILESLEEISNLHKALDHPIRLEILARLLTEPMEFSDLQEKLRIAKTSLANHLTTLVDCGLVEKRERGLYQISFDGEDILTSSAKIFLEIKVREQEKLETLRLRYEALINKYTVLGSEIKMVKENDFKIVNLPEMKVVSFHAMGEFLGDPEPKAGEKLYSWAEPQGLYDEPEKHRVFGFNNPDPKYDKESGKFVINKENPYGYEFWMTIDDDFEVDGNLTVKTIPEGLFVTTSCVGIDDLGRAWKELGDWVKESKEYKFAPHQCLEENTSPKISDGNKIPFILYFPVKK